MGFETLAIRVSPSRAGERRGIGVVTRRLTPRLWRPQARLPLMSGKIDGVRPTEPGCESLARWSELDLRPCAANRELSRRPPRKGLFRSRTSARPSTRAPRSVAFRIIGLE